MAKEKDISEKTLENYNDVFADIVNNLVFGGRNAVRPEELSDAAPTSQLKIDGRLHEQERDVAKFWNGKEIRLALFGTENMTRPERDLILRVIGYDGASYRAQYNQRLSDRRQRRQPRPIYPVLTLILYFGSGRWTGPKTLRECLETEVPPELLALLPDYRMHVVELARLRPEQIASFQSDFFLPVFYLNNPEVDPPGERVIRHVDETMKLMTAITNNPNYLAAAREVLAEGKGEGVSMSDMFARAEARGEARAREAYQAELARKNREIDELYRQLARYRAAEEAEAQGQGTDTGE